MNDISKYFSDQIRNFRMTLHGEFLLRSCASSKLQSSTLSGLLKRRLSIALFLSGMAVVSCVLPVMASQTRSNGINCDIDRTFDKFARGKILLAEAENDSGPSHCEHHKLKRVKFVNHHCTVLMPRQFDRKFESAGTGAKVGTYSGGDYPNGTLMLTCASVPQNCAASTLLLDRIATDKRSIKQVKNVTGCQMDGTPGRQFEVITTRLSPHHCGLIKGVVLGQNLYLLSAFGTKPWLESALVDRFFNSLEIDRERR